MHDRTQTAAARSSFWTDMLSINALHAARLSEAFPSLFRERLARRSYKQQKHMDATSAQPSPQNAINTSAYLLPGGRYAPPLEPPAAPVREPGGL